MKLQRLVISLSLGLIASGCSAIASFSDDCTSDSDCESGLVCRESFCVKPGGATPDAGTPTDSGVEPDSGMPSDAGMEPDAGPDPACTSNSECATRFSEDYICGPADECVSVQSADCTDYELPTNVDDMVLVASVFPVSPPFDRIAVPLRNAVLMAITEFNSAGGLPGGRQIGFINCNAQGQETRTFDAVTHLVEDLGVQAIVGPLFSGNYINMVQQLTAAAGVFTIAPTATSPSITGLNDNDLSWRTIPSDVFQGGAIISRLRERQAEKVVVFYKDDTYGRGLFSEVSANINQAGVMDQDVKYLRYLNPATVGFDPVQIQQNFAQVVMESLTDTNGLFLPDHVLFLGTSEAAPLAATYVASLKAALGTFPSAQQLPTLLFSHGGVPAMLDLLEVTDAMGNPIFSEAELDILSGNMEGISPVVLGDSDDVRNFNIRYASTYPGNMDNVTTAPLSYDATYLVLFALSGVQGEITGTKIAEQMANLVPSGAGGQMRTRLGDNPSVFVPDTRNALAAGESVDLVGVSGNLDFDLTTGDVRAPYVGWILAEDQAQNPIIRPVRFYVLEDPPSTGGIWLISDICEAPVPLVGGISIPGTFRNLVNDYSLDTGMACTASGPPASETGGPDSVYALVLATGQTLTATLTTSSATDPALYVADTCTGIGGVCLASADTTNASMDPQTPTQEVLTYQATSTGVHYLVVDSRGPGAPVDYLLEVGVQ